MRTSFESNADPFAPDLRAIDADATPAASVEGTKKRRGWRRLMQVNLLMVLVALALVSGYFAMRRNFLVPYLEQKAAREELAKRGAQFSAVPASPKWVQTLFQISDDDFQNVEMIKLENSDGIRDADLIHLHKFPHLRRLYLAATRITDDGLKHLRYCTKLRRISLWDTHVSDAGIRELETLQDLRIIDIHRTWTTDAALETLGKLPAMEELVLDDATTSRGVAHLAGLRHLRRLNLRSTSLEADCLESLVDCPIEILEVTPGFADRASAKNFRHVARVRSLSLSLPGATDDDLEWLDQMTSLRQLTLSDLRAEGDFAPHIADMQSLESLEIRSDRLRKEALLQLASAPRLSEAMIAAPLTEEDLTSIPQRRMSLRIYSPWLTSGLRELTSSDLRRQPRIEAVQGLGMLDAMFARGEAITFANQVPNYVTVDLLAPLLAQKRLTQLELHGWEFAPGALAALADLHLLESVTFDRCRFEPDELNALAALPYLRSFVVRDGPVRDEQLAALALAPRLQTLHVHFTDARAETVLALVAKESLTDLSIYSTTLNDAFLERVDRILARRARTALEPIAREGDLKEPTPRFRFVSTSFSGERTRAFRNRYTIAIGVAKAPGVENPGDYWGVWPREGTYGWIDPENAEALDLSPLGVDLPIVDDAPGMLAPRDRTMWRAAYAEFADAHFWSFHGLGNTLQPGPLREGDRTSWRDWRFGPIQETQQVVQIPLDCLGVETTERLLEIESHFLSLSEGSVRPENLDALARSKARVVVLGTECGYDEATLRAIASLPRVETVQFATCRKPTPKEVAILCESATLRTVEFEHRGEPVYFEEIAEPGCRANSVVLTGKVVYDAVDAIRERPKSVFLANFDEGLWPAILADSRSIMEVGLRGDWPNQLKLRFRLEALQRERDAAAEAKGATSEANPANLGKSVDIAS